jgi:hypothetical protein
MHLIGVHFMGVYLMGVHLIWAWPFRVKTRMMDSSVLASAISSPEGPTPRPKGDVKVVFDPHEDVGRSIGSLLKGPLLVS